MPGESDTRAVEPRKPLTVAALIAALVGVDDHAAVPEFTFDGEKWFQVFGVDVCDSVQLDVEPVSHG